MTGTPLPERSGFDALVVGGGVSGLAAALKLSDAGRSVALVELSGKLGGRCYSYVDQKSGDVVDNGQHVLIGAYHNTLRYLEIAGTRRHLRDEPALALPLLHPQSGFTTFHAASLPKPYHMIAGILGFRLLPLADRFGLLRIGNELRAMGKEEERSFEGLTIERWLDRTRQGTAARECLWYPLAVSVMNETPARASALLFARSLRAAFFGSAADSAILIPTIGQTELYVAPVEEILRKRGVTMILQDGVSELSLGGGRVSGAVLRSGAGLNASTVVSAVPPYALTRMLPPSLAASRPFDLCNRFEHVPIVSMHLWLEEDVFPHDYAGLIGGRVQWIFNRRRLIDGPKAPGGYLSCIISAAREFADRSNEELVALAIEDLGIALGRERTLRVTRSVVIREQRATFSATPDAERLRPPCVTPVRNFFLAGDWTATGLPATIEGAIGSGFRGAEEALLYLAGR